MDSFKQYLTEKRIKGYRAGSLNVGIIWLSSKPELADEYGADNNIPTKEYTFELKNPLYVRKSELERSLKDFVLDIINNTDGDIEKVKDLALRMIKNKKKRQIFQLWDEHYEDLKKLLTLLGYDGIQTREGGYTTYGIFNKRQLR